MTSSEPLGIYQLCPACLFVCLLTLCSVFAITRVFTCVTKRNNLNLRQNIPHNILFTSFVDYFYCYLLLKLLNWLVPWVFIYLVV